MGKSEPNLKMCLAESNLIQQKRPLQERQTVQAATPPYLTPHLTQILNISTSGALMLTSLLDERGRLDNFGDFGYLTFNVRLIVPDIRD